MIKILIRLTRSERETVIAEFAEFLFRISEPLEETFLVDVLDGAGADAGVEQGPVGGPLATAHPTNVWNQRVK